MRAATLRAGAGQSPLGNSPTRARATRRSTVVRSPVVAAVASSSTSTSTSTSSSSSSSPSSSTFDVVVIGSGLGGLSCAALLSRYGLRVRVLEAHSKVGGAAHSWSRKSALVPGESFRFESGPSLFSGMSPASGVGNRGGNPMAHVLAAAGVTSADLSFYEYDSWNVSLPLPLSLSRGSNNNNGGKEEERRKTRARFRARVGSAGFLEMLPTFSGAPAEARAQWMKLRKVMRPLAAAATAIPAVALRAGDPLGAALTAGVRYLPSVAASLPHLASLPRPFSETLDGMGINEPFLRNWLDLLCFLLCGLPASGTPTAEIAFMFNEWYSSEEASSSTSSSLLQFPLGGASAVAKALAASVERRGGVVSTRSRVESLVFSDDGKGRVVGVRLAGSNGGEVVRASRAVVSNADAAGTLALARAAEGTLSSSSSSSPASPSSSTAGALSAQSEKTPLLRSFVHLHAGFDASGLEGKVDMHHLRVESWQGGGEGEENGKASRNTSKIDAEGNVSLISIASVADPSLAPPGKHTLHAYYPATEPYDPWKKLLTEIERDGGMSKENNRAKYEEFKEFRARNLIAAAEEAVPGLRERSEVFLIGGPLTHERYLNRSKGSYGPGWIAGKGFPSTKGPAGLPDNLFCVGDFAFPGVGVPAVAASGAVGASSIVGAAEHWRLLNELGI